MDHDVEALPYIISIFTLPELTNHANYYYLTRQSALQESLDPVASRGLTNLLELLISKGVDVNGRDKVGVIRHIYIVDDSAIDHPDADMPIHDYRTTKHLFTALPSTDTSGPCYCSSTTAQISRREIRYCIFLYIVVCCYALDGVKHLQ